MYAEGYTQKFCHFCDRYTNHAIVQVDGLKGYVCMRHTNGGMTLAERQAKEMREQ